MLFLYPYAIGSPVVTSKWISAGVQCWFWRCLPFSALSCRNSIPEAGLDRWEVLQGKLGNVEWKDNFVCLLPASFCFKWCHLHYDCTSFYGITIALSWLHWDSMNPLEFHDSDMIHWLYKGSPILKPSWFYQAIGCQHWMALLGFWCCWDSMTPLCFHGSIMVSQIYWQSMPPLVVPWLYQLHG